MEGASGESGGERRATTVAPARRRGVGTVERRAAEGRGGGMEITVEVGARDLGFALTSGGRSRWSSLQPGLLSKLRAKTEEKSLQTH
jgi:hypothetical protein